MKSFISELIAVEESRVRASRWFQDFKLSIGVNANAETNNVGYFAIIYCGFLFGCVMCGVLGFNNCVPNEK